MRLRNALDPECVEDRRYGAGGLPLSERARARPVPDAAMSSLRATRHGVAGRPRRPSAVPLRAVSGGLRSATLTRCSEGAVQPHVLWDPLDGFKVARMKPSNPLGNGRRTRARGYRRGSNTRIRTAAHRRSTCAVAGRNSVLKALNWAVQ